MGSGTNVIDPKRHKRLNISKGVKISRDEKGIVTMSIYDFLMDKDSLVKC